MTKALRSTVESRCALKYYKVLLPRPTFITPARNLHEYISYERAWHGALDPFGYRFLLRMLL
jgi:hypothetical protein